MDLEEAQEHFKMADALTYNSAIHMPIEYLARKQNEYFTDRLWVSYP